VDFERIETAVKLSKCAEALEGLSLHVVVLSDDPLGIDASTNEDLDYHFTRNDETGLFLWYEDDEVHVNSIVVKKDDRGKGIGKEMVRAVVDNLRPKKVSFHDVSNGFWKRVELEFPGVEFVYE
jgi:ribosomal protein S18 acetylase RimI-like enzyme